MTRHGVASRRRLLAGVATLAVAIGLLLWVGRASLDVEVLAAQVRATGMLGPVVLLLLLVVQSVVAPLPSQPVLVAAGFVYGPRIGFSLGWLGVAVGACACFGLARAFGRPFVERFVSGPRLAAVDAYVSGRGLPATFLTVLSLRLFAHISFDAVSYGCGLVALPFRWFFVATAVGEVPKVLLLTSLGASSTRAPAWLVALVLAGVGATLAVCLWIRRRAAGGDEGC